MEQKNSISKDYRLPLTSRYWRWTSKAKYAPVQANHRKLLVWINETHSATWRRLNLERESFSQFRDLDTKIASASAKILTTHDFKKRKNKDETKAHNDNIFLKVTQIACMIYAYFKVSGTSQAILDFTDLMEVTLQGDSVQGFDTKWDETLFSMNKIPDEEIFGKCVRAATEEFWRVEIHGARKIHFKKVNRSATLDSNTWFIHTWISKVKTDCIHSLRQAGQSVR